MNKAVMEPITKIKFKAVSTAHTRVTSGNHENSRRHHGRSVNQGRNWCRTSIESGGHTCKGKLRRLTHGADKRQITDNQISIQSNARKPNVPTCGAAAKALPIGGVLRTRQSNQCPK